MKLTTCHLLRSQSAGLVAGLVLLLVISAIVGRASGQLPVGEGVTRSPLADWLKYYGAVAAMPPSPLPNANHLTASLSVAAAGCADNTGGKLLLVSISQRHLWACDGPDIAYDSPVISGMDWLAADLTPTGNFTIYGKQNNLYLKGADSTGSWNDYVNYWLPFLSNAYGVYGFHDATWRPESAFGNISQDSASASHGCVELPLSTAAWVYQWAPIGTAVTIVK